jgi:small subunit ribosomal protein S6
MPVQLYECMLILDSGKVAGDLQESVQHLHSTLEKHKGEVVTSRPWDEQRKLAYSIGKQKKALYYLLYFKIDSRSVPLIEADFKLNEAVLRYLVIRIDPKISEAMLAVAKDPHGMALQSANEELVDEFEMPTGRGG